MVYRNDDKYDSRDSFLPSYQQDTFPSSFVLLNHSYNDNFLLNLNYSFNKTDSYTIINFSSPFTYLILITISYLILTVILLVFSLYRQREIEIENFYFGDTVEDIQQEKRYAAWKKLLIGKIKKGDMEPLLSDRNHQFTNSGRFPSHIV